MTDIVLATLNARWIHAAFGLRCLRANLGDLRPRSTIVEFDAQTRAADVVERLLVHRPRIVGFGVYIWNVARLTEVVRTLRKVAPEVIVVLGGPEVSHETEGQAIVAAADYVVRGEGDLAFAELCRSLLCGQRPPVGVIDAPQPELHRLTLPYDEYDATDLAHRVIYVEASRGCPFTCEFCLSALDERVRAFPLDGFLAAMQRLLDRGARQFKFVDRTFNLGLGPSVRILSFFRERLREGSFLHFELIPDRLPPALRAEIVRFPPGTLQFEVGIQTFAEDVATRIGRRQDNAKAVENLTFLRQHTGVHLHTDLIVGLPGEDLESFGRGFDRLLALRPHEIQVGILKRLRGTPIGRHDSEWRMAYGDEPPYEVVSTATLDFATLQRLRRFARYFDLLHNSGNFKDTLELLWRDASPFAIFLSCSDWLHARTEAQHGIALHRLAGLLFEFATTEARLAPEVVGRAMWDDFQRTRPNDWPAFLRPYASAHLPPVPRVVGAKRQARHAARDPALAPPSAAPSPREPRRQADA
ncbi:MAG: DUF4080 domain-containing protein [Planctomycetota bacterium]